MNDFLEARTMNLNVRVSPTMKLKLVERIRKLGLNLTDYIYLAITKSETLESDVAFLNEEKERADKEVERLKDQLQRYEHLIEPFAKDLIGKEITNKDNRRITLKNAFEVAEFILSNFKTQKR